MLARPLFESRARGFVLCGVRLLALDAGDEVQTAVVVPPVAADL